MSCHIRDTADRRKQAIADAIAKLAALTPYRVPEPVARADGYELAKDLDALAAIIDPIIEAWGDYAASHLGISEQDRKDCFVDQLRGALNGMATHVVVKGAEARVDEFEPEYASLWD